LQVCLTVYDEFWSKYSQSPVSSAILFYVAKKRQWAIREKIRRSARRVAESIKSPMTPRFPKSAGNAPLLSSKPQASVMASEKSTAERLTGRSGSAKGANLFLTPNHPQKKTSHAKKRWDLEQGIELGSTKTMTTRVSTQNSSNSEDIDRSQSKKGWGSRFSFAQRAT
jgi:hypothetical protein